MFTFSVLCSVVGVAAVAAGHPTDGLAVPAVLVVAEAGENAEPEFERHAVVRQLADSAAIAGPYPVENLASDTPGLGN